VRVEPGLTALAVTLVPRSSSASARISPAVELLARHPPERHAAADHPGCRDECVNAAVLALGAGDRREHRALVGGVGLDRAHAPVGLGSHRLEAVDGSHLVGQPQVIVPAVDRDDAPAVRGQPLHGRRPDPAGGAGHDRRAAHGAA
jgi:hypothetical protein